MIVTIGLFIYFLGVLSAHIGAVATLADPAQLLGAVIVLIGIILGWTGNGR